MPVALHDQILASSPVDVENAAPTRTTDMSESGHADTGTNCTQEKGYGCAGCETVSGRLTVDGSESRSGHNGSEFDGNVQSVEGSITASSVMSAPPVAPEPQGTNRRSRAAKKAKSEREEELRSLSNEMSQISALRTSLLAKNREKQRGVSVLGERS